jgi:hypothetical protein
MRKPVRSTLLTTISTALLLWAGALPSYAGGFDAELFERFVDSNMGRDGRPVYYYSTGTVHKASRKMFVLRDPRTGEVIEQVDGKALDDYFYPYQYMTFRLDGSLLRGTATQGAGAAKRSVDVGSAMEARRVGDVAVFSAPNARARPDGTGTYEMYEFWVQPLGSTVQPSTTLTLTLVNWHPIGRGKPVYTHRTSWRVDRYEALPASLREWIDAKAPLYREPPRDMAEIERLQQ